MFRSLFRSAVILLLLVGVFALLLNDAEDRVPMAIRAATMVLTAISRGCRILAELLQHYQEGLAAGGISHKAVDGLLAVRP